MKNHSCTPGCNKGLKSICGSVIDIDDINFAPSQNHLLYIDKVYSKGHATACPIVFNVSTNTNNFRTQLLTAPMTEVTENLCEEIFGCGCGCGCEENSCGCGNNSCGCGNNSCGNNHCGNNSCGNHNNCNNCVTCCGNNSCIIGPDAVFEVVRSYVLVKSFELATPCSLCANQVTIDGTPVDSLECMSGAYEAFIRNTVPEVVKETCAERGYPTQTFFLITSAGPWSYEAEFVVEGKVTTGGRACCFKAKFDTNSIQPISNATSNLAVPHLSIPCISAGIAPRLFFAFNGKMSLLNPTVTVTMQGQTPVLVLNSAVVAEPTVTVEVVKKSLFCLNACEAIFPCQGTPCQLEEEEEVDEAHTFLNGPCCHCNTGSASDGCGCDTVSGASDNEGCGCRSESSSCDCTANSSFGNNMVYNGNSYCGSCGRGF